MEPWLGVNDKIMFYKYLNKTTNYFEYGSGGSTYQANIRNNIKKIYSVESDKDWHNIIRNNISLNKVTYIYNDLNTLPNTWGEPGPDCTSEQKINYSNHIKNLTQKEQESIDFIFIDGRFRVACCLKTFDVINTNCFIGFDDFFGRKQYHLVLDYFDIVEKTIDNNMVILKKKNNVNIPDEIIKHYELISD